MPWMRIRVEESTDKTLKTWARIYGLRSKARAVEAIVEGHKRRMMKEIVTELNKSLIRNDKIDAANETLQTTPDHGIIKYISRELAKEEETRGDFDDKLPRVP